MPSKKRITTAALEPGARVKLTSRGLVGKLFSGPDNQGKCEVYIGSMKVLAHSSELEILPPSKKQASPQSTRTIVPESDKILRLDLHGKRVAQALEMLEGTLDLALRQGITRIEIIHGIGTGAVRDAIIKYLHSNKHVAQVRPDIVNPGVTWAHI